MIYHPKCFIAWDIACRIVLSERPAAVIFQLFCSAGGLYGIFLATSTYPNTDVMRLAIWILLPKHLSKDYILKGVNIIEKKISCSYCYLREIDLLRFLEMVRIFFTNVINRLSMIYLSARDWHEESPSFYETADTHNYDTRILLTNRLRNQ